MRQFFEETAHLLSFDFVIASLIACALLGFLSGVLAPLVVIRQMAFAVHATSELALMGAAIALVASVNLSLGAVAGSVTAAIAFVMLGLRGGNDSAVGAVMSFGMGVSVLCIYLYPGNSTVALGLLTGQVAGVSNMNLVVLAVSTLIILVAIAVLWRPLMFASVDPAMAAATGVRVRFFAVAFGVLLGIASAQAVQVVGALLVMSLLITPGASAVAITDNPVAAIVWSVVFAQAAAVGGLIFSLAPGIPISVTVAFISFGIYILCRLVERVRVSRLQKMDA
ncbi:metal ABC transporter permease [Corynebacterium sanguinis]|uniref:Metal ABC transporter permease n=1 Tax=Corynebacterium sanguinis TaxID=2594913 RepID=A0A838X079_9CORY|nr:metal ABC transporter permease [Corynebacterium sanguinis]MBA4506363.1 metal ABC transporter permease [Corynebacterium sanguinis]MCT1411507.1 metal ABC transporter permease [Corynebacterium sanguinis]MCT1426088.1 metal ABC transporter permease [Corynebacterium sanguinis]MCT1492517.1 metal ABC transporter permease [Corynebacterium sanguinis]MCT1499303.1 metal ABC transporter permease [Corynebacterium sanguinis]